MPRPSRSAHRPKSDTMLLRRLINNLKVSSPAYAPPNVPTPAPARYYPSTLRSTVTPVPGAGQRGSRGAGEEGSQLSDGCEDY